MELFIWLVAGALGFVAGWLVNEWRIRRRNRNIARKMVESVRATKSRRDPANMMDYTNRQRTVGAQDNTTAARQGRVRFRSRSLRR